VLRRIGLAGGAGTALVGRDLNFDVHIPMATAETRFGDIVVSRGSGSMEAKQMELSELYLEVPTMDAVRPVADQVNLLIDSAHAKAGDVSVVVPLELLDEAERRQRMFNILMAIIAGLSLIVGGIGIMNIMLASVTERIREIGIRRAVGATRKHITSQFLIETIVLSGIGGVLGVAFGFLFTGLLQLIHYAGWIEALGRPYVTPFWVIVSFIIASSVGVIFGLYPAIHASKQDPIVALRHD
jgi:putative ABC transport system permease protein